MSKDISHAIVPISFVDSPSYEIGNDEISNRSIVGNINELFVNPYNVHVLYPPETTSDSDPVNASIASMYEANGYYAMDAYVRMNVKDMLTAVIVELYNDISIVANRNIATNINISDIDCIFNGIEHPAVNLERIYINSIEYLDRFASQFALKLISDEPSIVKNLYENFVDDTEGVAATVYDSNSNLAYVSVSAVIRDIIELKAAYFKAGLDKIRLTLNNMFNYKDTVILDDNENIIGVDNEYRDYLINTKYATDSDDEE